MSVDSEPERLCFRAAIFIKPEEVANLIVFVCSPASSGTNGAALEVEGSVVRSMT